jgi:RNA polymerase sigma factor (sigma-70 family)
MSQLPTTSLGRRSLTWHSSHSATPEPADLVADVTELDSFAWRGVYEQHAERLTRLATVLVGPDDASDLVVDTVRRVFSNRSATGQQTWQSLPDLDAYLTRSLVNAAMSHHRSTGRRRRREERAAPSDVVAPIDPTNALDVRKALVGLSPQQRAIVFLAYWDDLTIPQIANRLDVSEGTIRRQLARAKTRLREVLQ